MMNDVAYLRDELDMANKLYAATQDEVFDLRDRLREIGIDPDANYSTEQVADIRAAVEKALGR